MYTLRLNKEGRGLAWVYTCKLSSIENVLKWHNCKEPPKCPPLLRCSHHLDDVLTQCHWGSAPQLGFAQTQKLLKEILFFQMQFYSNLLISPLTFSPSNQGSLACGDFCIVISSNDFFSNSDKQAQCQSTAASCLLVYLLVHACVFVVVCIKDFHCWWIPYAVVPQLCHASLWKAEVRYVPLHSTLYCWMKDY